MPETHGGASEKAREAARTAMLEDGLKVTPFVWQKLLGDPGGPFTGRVADALEAAHDPVLGLDRSVNLRDAVHYLTVELGHIDAGIRLERRFTEGGS